MENGNLPGYNRMGKRVRPGTFPGVPLKRLMENGNLLGYNRMGKRVRPGTFPGVPLKRLMENGNVPGYNRMGKRVRPGTFPGVPLKRLIHWSKYWLGNSHTFSTVKFGHVEQKYRGIKKTCKSMCI